MVKSLEGEPSPKKLIPVYLESNKEPAKAFGFLGSHDSLNPPLLMVPEGAKTGDCLGIPIEGRPNLKFFRISGENKEGLIGGWLPVKSIEVYELPGALE